MQYFGEDAGVTGIKVGDQHESHPADRRHVVKKFLECLQATGRRTHPHDTEGDFLRCFRSFGLVGHAILCDKINHDTRYSDCLPDVHQTIPISPTLCPMTRVMSGVRSNMGDLTPALTGRSTP